LINCLFVTDIHGLTEQYEKLFAAIARERPQAVFLGGDLMPSGMFYRYKTSNVPDDFINDYLALNFSKLRDNLGDDYPRIFLILGNDDGRIFETDIIANEKRGIWEYAHQKIIDLFDYQVRGYAYVPPTPFQLKDWEKYDVSRYTDPGCVSPEEGSRTAEIESNNIKYATIKNDLDKMVNNNLEKTIFLFHTPPYQTKLDRTALDDKMVDHVPLDVNTGSIAVRRFIETNQPYLTLHGHIHESASITGSWRDNIGKTVMFSAAHNGPELSLVRFDLADLSTAMRELI
jgi:uncharacterized protein